MGQAMWEAFPSLASYDAPVTLGHCWIMLSSMPIRPLAPEVERDHHPEPTSWSGQISTQVYREQRARQVPRKNDPSFQELETKPRYKQEYLFQPRRRLILLHSQLI